MNKLVLHNWTVKSLWPQYSVPRRRPLWHIGDIPSDTASLAEPPYKYSNFDMLVGLALFKFVSSDISLILLGTDAV